MKKQLKNTLHPYLIGQQHVGYLVNDLSCAVEQWQALFGFEDTSVRFEPAEGIDTPTRFAFITIANTEIELIQPLKEPFTSLLAGVAKGPAGINHLAWRVSDLEAAYSALQQQGVRAGYVTPDGIVSFANKKILYLDPQTTGGHLIELIEITE